MREVTIPNDYNPFRLEVNGRIYSYKAGTTQSVPDEVAELIDMYKKSKPVPKENSIIDNNGLGFQKTDADKVLKVKEDGSDVEWAESGLDIPEYTAADAGKILTVNSSGTGVEWAQAQGGSGIFWITTTEVEQGDDTFLITLDKTFLEIYTAMQNHLLCVIIYSSNPDDDPPTSYAARHGVVKEIYYNSSDGAVVEADMTFTCSSVNDYPEAAD